jgi:hypothetical protein
VGHQNPVSPWNHGLPQCPIPGPKDIIPFVGQRQGGEQVAEFIAKLAVTQDAECI